MNKPVQVVHSKHPLLPAADRATYTAVHVPNETVAQLLQRCGVRLLDTVPVVVQVNGRRLSRADLYVVSVHEDDIVVVRGGVEGGKGSNVLAIIAVVALMVFTYGQASWALPALAGAAGITGTALIALQAAVLIGGQLLINQLFPPKIGKADPADTSPTYSLTGGGNAMRPYAPLPLAMGTVRMVPDMAAKPYTDYIGEDQFLYQIFNFGLSDIELSQIKIGDTPIENLEDLSVQITTGSNADGRAPWQQTLVHGNVDTIDGGGLLEYDVELNKTTSINTTAIGLDFSGNLFRTTDSGKYKDEEVVVSIQFRKVGTTAWYDFTETTPWTETTQVRYGKGYKEVVVQSVKGYVISNDSTKPVRASLYRAVDQGQYEVKVRKLNFDIPEQGDDDYDKDKHKNRTAQIGWTQVRSYQVDSTDYTGQTRLSVIVRASGQLSGAIEALSAVVSAKVPVWTGSDWVVQATSNPAWIYLWFARGKRDTNGKKIFGVGLDDSLIDIATITEWAAWCDAMDLTFNWVLDVDMSNAEVLATIARVGRGTIDLSSGKLGVIYDRSDVPVTQMFGMSNIIAGTFEVNYISENLADEIIVEFINPDLNWQQDTVRVVVPGVVNPQSSVSYPIAGITDKDQAGREANLQAAAQALFRKRVSFETDIEGLVSKRGDKIKISHDTTSWSFSGRLEAGSTASHLVLSREITFGDAEETPWVSVRHPDGTIEILEVEYPAEGPLTTDEITLVGSLGINPATDANNDEIDYIFHFDPRKTPGEAFKITSIEPISENRVKIIARQEDDAYYEAEDGDYTYVVPPPINVGTPTISGITVNEELIDPVKETVKVHLSWDIKNAEQTIVRVAGEGDQFLSLGTVNATSMTFLWYQPETITIELTPVSAVRLKTSPGTQTIQYTIKGTSSLPEDVAAQVPNVNGLQLFGDSNQSMQFTGSDAKFKWRKAASSAAELGAELQGGDSGSGDDWFRDYEVKVLSAGGSVRRVEYVQDESYTYTFEKNFEDGNGTPSREFRVEVRVRGTQGQFSPRPARIYVRKPAPDVPAGISATSAFTTAAVSYGIPNDTDFAGVLVWMDTTTGFTPGEGNLRADTNANTVVIGALTSGVTYYFRIAAYDKFGKTGLNVSSEFSATTYKVQTSDLSSEVLALLTTGDADFADDIAALETAINNEISNRVAAVTAEAAARVAADNAEASVRAAAITTEATTRATADTALSASLTTLGTTVSGNTAAIASEASTRSAADSALSASILTLNTTVSGNSSSITTINGTLSTLSGTVATHTTTLASHTTDLGTLTTTTATHTSQISTITSDVGSVSSSLTSLSSTVSGHTTSITANTSSINGIEAKYTVKIDNNGYIAGYGLISTANNGTPTSEFTVLADKFSIWSGSGSTIVNPFTVSGGVVYMPNAVVSNFAAGSITGDKIAAATIAGSNIQATTIDASKLNVSSLSSITATIGLLRTATSGARVEIEDNQIRVYDSSGTLRCRLGVW